jgi:hypothetical protein
MYFDRFDICEAWYLYAADYHAGMWSKEYAIFGRLNNIGFKPSPLLSYDGLTDNGKEIYDDLVNGANINDRS